MPAPSATARPVKSALAPALLRLSKASLVLWPAAATEASASKSFFFAASPSASARSSSRSARRSKLVAE
jgi:hypothetical protein